jgi:hypothetical protein
MTSMRENFSPVATATREAGMQQGSLIRSARKRGPDVWQFRWADRGAVRKAHLSQAGESPATLLLPEQVSAPIASRSGQR